MSIKQGLSREMLEALLEVEKERTKLLKLRLSECQAQQRDVNQAAVVLNEAAKDYLSLPNEIIAICDQMADGRISLGIQSFRTLANSLKGGD